MILMNSLIKTFEDYLKNTKKVSANTIVSYVRDVSDFNRYLCSNFENTNLTKCTDEDLYLYISYLTSHGKASSTITRTLASIRSFFSFLITKKIISENPANTVRCEKKKKTLPRILTNKEVDLFLNQPKCDSLKGYRDKAMLELLYATGIRVSELISLNVKDINLELGLIKCGKDNTERLIPLYAVAISAITNYLELARPFLLSDAADAALFVNLNGERMTRQGFWKIIKRYGEAAGIPTEITPNVLRHSFATHLLENGADIMSIKEMMGHSDVSSTLIYTQLIKSDLRNTYAKYHPRA